MHIIRADNSATPALCQLSQLQIIGDRTPQLETTTVKIDENRQIVGIGRLVQLYRYLAERTRNGSGLVYGHRRPTLVPDNSGRFGAFANLCNGFARTTQTGHYLGVACQSLGLLRVNQSMGIVGCLTWHGLLPEFEYRLNQPRRENQQCLSPLSELGEKSEQGSHDIGRRRDNRQKKCRKPQIAFPALGKKKDKHRKIPEHGHDCGAFAQHTVGPGEVSEQDRPQKHHTEIDRGDRILRFGLCEIT